MTTEELIKKLQKLPPDLNVYISSGPLLLDVYTPKIICVQKFMNLRFKADKDELYDCEGVLLR